jgi:hypothetical protein
MLYSAYITYSNKVPFLESFKRKEWLVGAEGFEPPSSGHHVQCTRIVLRTEILARKEGFEPPTNGFGNHGSTN